MHVKIPLAALCAAFVVSCAGCAAPLPPGFDISQAMGGGTTDRSNPNAPKFVNDTKIVSFKTLYKHEGIRYMVQKDGRWVPDEEKNARRPHGFYRFSAVREDGHARISAEFSKAEKYEFQAPLSALDELHAALIANKLPEINGFSKWNSALGTFFSVDVQYSSGETIRAYGEGGASCEPPVGLGFLIDTFRSLTEKYVPASERPNWPDYEKSGQKQTFMRMGGFGETAR